MLVQNNVGIGDFHTYMFGYASIGGTTWRNNVLVIPNSVRNTAVLNVPGPQCLVRMEDSGVTTQDADDVAAPTIVSNNTLVNRLTDANVTAGAALSQGIIYDNSSPYTTGFVEARNIIAEPALNTPNLPNGAVDLTLLFNAEKVGDYQDYSQGPFAGTGTPAASPTLGTPSTGSSSIGEFSSALLARDIVGTTRAASDTRGAVYVAA